MGGEKRGQKRAHSLAFCRATARARPTSAVRNSTRAPPRAGRQARGAGGGKGCATHNTDARWRDCRRAPSPPPRAPGSPHCWWWHGPSLSQPPHVPAATHAYDMTCKNSERRKGARAQRSKAVRLGGCPPVGADTWRGCVVQRETPAPRGGGGAGREEAREKSVEWADELVDEFSTRLDQPSPATIQSRVQPLFMCRPVIDSLQVRPP